MATRHVSYVNARGEFIDNAYTKNWCGWPQRETCPRCREMSRYADRDAEQIADEIKADMSEVQDTGGPVW
jgi:hypothetical protein